MAQSPIAEARVRRDETALAPSQYEAAEGELSAAEGQATAAATDALARIEQGFNETTDALLVEGADLRSAYETLATEARSGRLSADELAARLEDLARRRSSLDTGLSKLGQAIELADRIETDPVAYIDAIWRRFPQTAPQFSF